jgi:hypothetical protein
MKVRARNVTTGSGNSISNAAYCTNTAESSKNRQDTLQQSHSSQFSKSNAKCLALARFLGTRNEFTQRNWWGS